MVTICIKKNLHFINKRFIYARICLNTVNLGMQPAQSPDFNPIELVWNDLKFYFRNNIKPNNLIKRNRPSSYCF